MAERRLDDDEEWENGKRFGPRARTHLDPLTEKIIEERRRRGITTRRQYTHGVRHGKYSWASNSGCKCDPCRKVRAAYMREWRLRRKSAEADLGRDVGQGSEGRVGQEPM